MLSAHGFLRWEKGALLVVSLLLISLLRQSNQMNCYMNYFLNQKENYLNTDLRVLKSNIFFRFSSPSLMVQLEVFRRKWSRHHTGHQS